MLNWNFQRERGGGGGGGRDFEKISSTVAVWIFSGSISTLFEI